MRIIDILNSPPCKKIFDELGEFAGRSLKEYNNRIETHGFSKQAKDIFDTVWGSIELSAVEMCILDSPLLQRLRKIQQLGLANLTYCGANHSRFGHTLGVVEASGRMAIVVSGKLKSNNNSTYCFYEIVRLAALFHDVGHMFFSHISEQFFANNKGFSRYQEVNDMLIHFSNETSRNIPLHELFGIMLVNAEETRRLIDFLSRYLEKSRITEKEHLNQIIEYISCLIIGVPIDENVLPYSTIINGPIDADKLDYLSRDSYYTKVPIAVDISRLIQKLEVVSIQDIAKSNIWNDNPHSNIILYKMALKNSALRAFFQLSTARSILFESVYFHQKVLTAESMLRNAFEKILYLMRDEQKDFSSLFPLTDDAFNEYLNFTIIPENKRYQEEAKEVCEIIYQVRNRELYKRVITFSQDTVIGARLKIDTFLMNIIEHPNEEHSESNNEMTTEFFINEMTTEYFLIRKILKKSEIPKLPKFMFVEYPVDKGDNTKMDIPIECGNGRFKMSSESFQNEICQNSKETRLKRHFFVTDQIDRDLVFLALEKVLLTNYNIRLTSDASTCAKFSDVIMYNNRNQLFESGYYDNILTLITDEMLFNLIDKSLFDTVINKFQSYEGVNNSKVTRDTLFNYLKQFLQLQCSKSNIKIIIDGVLKLLKSSTFIDREFFVKNVSALLVKIQELEYNNNIIVSLGGIFDSGAHLSYYFNDIKDKQKFLFPETIDMAVSLLKKDDSLIFFDDGAYSGKQVVSIFQEMMGVPKERRATNETHVHELSEEYKKIFKNSNIVLSYLCFNPNSEEYIKGELKELGIENIGIIYINSLEHKVFEDAGLIFKSTEQKSIIRQSLSEIGESLLYSTKCNKKGQLKENWNEERIKKSSLGYNDAQQIVVFKSNIPTYTITALWANGKYKESEWRGLFQRTDKD